MNNQKPNPQAEGRSQKEPRGAKAEGTGALDTLASELGIRCSFRLRTSIIGLLVLLTFCLGARAQPYAINWHTIDGGGGTSTGGVYSVSGTIGQPDARTTPMTGGPYSLIGGFWAIHAIQTPGAPLLSIAAAGSSQATVSWKPDSPGWVLQETLSLSPINWMNSASGTNNPVTVPATSATKFYRLHKP